MESLKESKEAFVSGLTGTTLTEINLVTLSLGAGYLLRCLLLVSLPQFQLWSTSNLYTSFILEYLTIVLPGVLVFTVLADHSLLFLTLTLLLCLHIAVRRTVRTYTIADYRSVIERALQYPFPKRLPFLTLTRTYINLFTAIAILAVDFTVFPRRFAKAETYGCGLMDVGVGAFLMAHGGTAPEARYRNASSASVRSYLKLLALTLRAVLPLFVLGMLRLVAVKWSGYQEHVTEYGVHWNFFFTVAFVRLLCSILHPLLNWTPRLHLYGLAAVILAVFYQCSLSWWGVGNYIILGPHGNGSRPTLFSANREGVISCVGYLAVYTGSIELGRWLFRTRTCTREFIPVLVKLFLLDVACWVLTYWCGVFVEPVSRRMVNLTYILWIFSYGTMMLTLFLTVDLTVIILGHAHDTPLPPPYTASPEGDFPNQVCLISAVDFNQLAFFVAANLLTGLVNFSMDTLNASGVVSVAVILVYMAVLGSIFVVLHKHRIKIKI